MAKRIWADQLGRRKSVCPYFITEGVYTITCDGILDGTQNLIRFVSQDERLNYIRENCATFNYGNCPIAKNISANML